MCKKDHLFHLQKHNEKSKTAENFRNLNDGKQRLHRLESPVTPVTLKQKIKSRGERKENFIEFEIDGTIVRNIETFSLLCHNLCVFHLHAPF